MLLGATWVLRIRHAHQHRDFAAGVADLGNYHEALAIVVVRRFTQTRIQKKYFFPELVNLFPWRSLQTDVHSENHGTLIGPQLIVGDDGGSHQRACEISKPTRGVVLLSADASGRTDVKGRHC